MIRKFWLLLSFCMLIFSNAYTQADEDFVGFINRQHRWVDSVFEKLTPKERIGQLFLVRVRTDSGERYIDSVAEVIRREQLGGLVVFHGELARHVEMFNHYQSLAKVPLLLAFDGEWGLGMRLPGKTISYPFQMTLGAIKQDTLLYEMGKQVAKDFRRMGMHFNFAPVVDVNNNAQNPVIHVRSFGDNKYNVVCKAKAYMNGLLDGGVIASLKHFPGHGDTDVDSHKDLPQLDFSRGRLDSLELFPFRALIQAGAPAVMVAHMHVPALDATPHIPASISKQVVHGLLQQELGFRGLVVTDAMDMEGVKKFFPEGEADVMAILAGNDLIELSENSARAIELIVEAIRDNHLKQEEIDRRVKRVLAAKYWLGLDRYRPIDTLGLSTDLNRVEAKCLVQRLADSAVTVLKSHRTLGEFAYREKTAIVTIGGGQSELFERDLIKRFPNGKVYVFSGQETRAEVKRYWSEIQHNRQLVLVVHDTRSRPGNTIVTTDAINELISQLAKRNACAVLFTSPYVLDALPLHGVSSIVLGYQNDDFMQKAVLKVFLGDMPARGRLPVTVNKHFVYGDGE